MPNPEGKGDGAVPSGKDSCHTLAPRGNVFRRVNLFRSSFVGTLLVFYLSNKTENVLSKKLLLCMYAEKKMCFVLLGGMADCKATCPCLL